MTTTMKRRIWERATQTTCLHRPTMPWETATTNRIMVRISSEKGVVCREAMEKKKCKQQESVKKALKICGQASHRPWPYGGKHSSLKAAIR
jgi:hypothetical protein